MVEVGDKDVTRREAVAEGFIAVGPEALALVRAGTAAKGDVLAVAQLAGIQAAKRTADLIPLCHPLLVGSVLVNFRIVDTYIEIEAQVETVDPTGVEMEALTACSIAALTIYDMCKSADKSMTIGGIALWEKTGGRSGVYRRDETGQGGGLDANGEGGSTDGGARYQS